VERRCLVYTPRRGVDTVGQSPKGSLKKILNCSWCIYIMQIIEANHSDFDKVTDLYYKLYPDRKGANLIHIKDPIFKSKILVAKEANKIEGFILATFVSYAKSKFGYIEELVVDEKSRGRQIGSKLVKKILAWEKLLGAEVVFVITDEAMEFYKRLGFKHTKKYTWLLWTPQ
jgi:N-acetylglutamate synthase-like GNAT family acetyltransferase